MRKLDFNKVASRLKNTSGWLLLNIFFFHRSYIITNQTEILQKSRANKLGKYMLYYSYDKIFCKVQALQVLI